MLTSGSLFSGYLGLDLAITRVFGAQLRWVSDIEQYDKKGSQIGNAPAILKCRAPGVPNLGDITKVDWSRVEPVTVVGGGSPCQDVSLSGNRAGMTEGTRSNLWVAMREAIAVLKPAFVVWENVRGVLSARADSAVEPCTGCLGDGGAEPHLRALGRVLGDLADLGFDAEWEGLRAADVGAPHGRYRIFVLAAHPERVARLQWEYQPGPSGAFAETARRDRASVELLPTPTASRYGSNRSASAGAGVRSSLDSIGRLLPTPTTQPCTGNGHARNLGEEVRLLPTPRATRGGSRSETVELLLTPKTTDSKSACAADLKRNDPGLRALPALLPIPRASDGAKGGPNQRGSSGDLMLPAAVMHQYGQYQAAIERWEQVMGRVAPAPTGPGSNGGQRLSPRFVEWLMGCSDGWVTDVPGLTRNQQLHALGNGVATQQAEEALWRMIPRILDVRSAA